MPAQNDQEQKSNSQPCLICDRAATEGEARFIYQSEHYRVRHSDETDLSGYLIVESRRHFLDLSHASPGEADDLGAVIARATRAIHIFCQPQRVYSFTLAEAVPHFHMHLIPRAADLDSAYVGRGIMAYPLNPALAPQKRQEVAAQLQKILSQSA